MYVEVNFEHIIVSENLLNTEVNHLSITNKA